MHVTAEEVIETLPHTQRRSVYPTLGNMTEDFLSSRYYDRRQRCPAFWVQLGGSGALSSYRVDKLCPIAT